MRRLPLTLGLVLLAPLAVAAQTPPWLLRYTQNQDNALRACNVSLAQAQQNLEDACQAAKWTWTGTVCTKPEPPKPEPPKPALPAKPGAEKP